MKKTSFVIAIALPLSCLNAYAGSPDHSYPTDSKEFKYTGYTHPKDLPKNLQLSHAFSLMQKNKKPLTFGVLANLNYKHSSTGDNFLGGRINKFSIGALQFDANAQLADWFSASASGTYTMDAQTGPDHQFILDDAHIAVGGTSDMPYTFITGYSYLPFGTYHPYSLSGSLNKTLEEAQNTFMALKYSQKGFDTEFYFYGRGKKVNNESKRLFPVAENYGIKSNYTWHGAYQGFQLSGGYINNFREVSVIADLNPRNLDRVGALSAHMNYFYHHIGFLTDYTSATSRFNSTSMSFNTKGARPSAWQAEGYVHFKVGNLPSVLGLGYGHSSNGLPLQMFSHRIYSNYSVLFNKHISLQLQYTISHDYKTSDTGTMNRSGLIITNTGTGKTAHTIQAQLSFALGDEHPGGYSELTDSVF